MLNQIDVLKSLILSFPWLVPSWSLFVFLFWLIVAGLYTATSVGGRIITILVCVYMAKLLMLEAPFIAKYASSHMSGVSVTFVNLIVFGGLFLILFVFLSRYAFKTSFDSHSPKTFVISGGFALLQVGLLINILLNLLPQTFQANFHPLIHFIFIRPEVGFFWLILPVLYLIVLGKHLASQHTL